jgi:hypothetical protein
MQYGDLYVVDHGCRVRGRGRHPAVGDEDAIPHHELGAVERVGCAEIEEFSGVFRVPQLFKNFLGRNIREIRKQMPRESPPIVMCRTAAGDRASDVLFACDGARQSLGTTAAGGTRSGQIQAR